MADYTLVRIKDLVGTESDVNNSIYIPVDSANYATDPKKITYATLRDGIIAKYKADHIRVGIDIRLTGGVVNTITFDTAMDSTNYALFKETYDSEYGTVANSVTEKLVSGFKIYVEASCYVQYIAYIVD